jgi:signal transduction histidine kinase
MLEALRSIAAAAGTSHEVTEIARAAVAAIRPAFRADAVALFLRDGADGGQRFQLAEGFSPSVVERLRSAGARDISSADLAIKTNSPVSFPIKRYPDGEIRGLLEKDGFTFVADAPLLSRKVTIGILRLARRNSAPFSEAQLQMLAVAATITGVAIDGARAYDEAMRQRDQLRALSAENVSAREEEARRIARELHDEAGQLLAGVHIALEGMARELPASAYPRVLETRALLDRIEAQLRGISHQLRPPVLDTLGLKPALEFLAGAVSARTGAAVSVSGSTGGRLPNIVETALYRIAQEALNNVAKHARATRGSVELARTDGRIECTIRDDGAGFRQIPADGAPSPGGLGLIGVRERLDAVGGSLRITSTPGEGTELFITKPLTLSDHPSGADR